MLCRGMADRAPTSTRDSVGLPRSSTWPRVFAPLTLEPRVCSAYPTVGTAGGVTPSNSGIAARPPTGRREAPQRTSPPPLQAWPAPPAATAAAAAPLRLLGRRLRRPRPLHSFRRTRTSVHRAGATRPSLPLTTMSTSTLRKRSAMSSTSCSRCSKAPCQGQVRHTSCRTPLRQVRPAARRFHQKRRSLPCHVACPAPTKIS